MASLAAESKDEVRKTTFSHWLYGIAYLTMWLMLLLLFCSKHALTGSG